MKYKNIIFDLGAVLFDLNYQLTKNAFIEIGLKDFDSVFSKYNQQNYFDQYERGEITDKEFRSQVKQHLPSHVTDAMINDAWNAMLIGIPVHRYDWLKQISEKHNIYLLSNTNGIHISEVKKSVEKDYGWQKFESIFNKVYYSCEIGMRKPEVRIFEHVINENNLEKASTLFIDDSPQHITGAMAADIHAIHLDDGVSVEDLFLGVTPL